MSFIIRIIHELCIMYMFKAQKTPFSSEWLFKELSIHLKFRIWFDNIEVTKKKSLQGEHNFKRAKAKPHITHTDR